MIASSGYQWYQREECYWCYPFAESGDTVWEKGFIRKTVEERIKNAAKPSRRTENEINRKTESTAISGSSADAVKQQHNGDKR